MAAYGLAYCTTVYEGKSYRMFVDWLVEAYYLRLFLQLSRIPHFTTLQKFADRISIVHCLERNFLHSSYLQVLDTHICRYRFNWIQGDIWIIRILYTERSKLRRRKYTKLSIGADLLQQIICNIKIRRATTTRHDNVDFKPIVTRTSGIMPSSLTFSN